MAAAAATAIRLLPTFIYESTAALTTTIIINGFIKPSSALIVVYGKSETKREIIKRYFAITEHTRKKPALRILVKSDNITASIVQHIRVGTTKNIRQFESGEISVAVPKKNICIGRVISATFTDITAVSITERSALLRTRICGRGIMSIASVAKNEYKNEIFVALYGLIRHTTSAAQPRELSESLSLHIILPR